VVALPMKPEYGPSLGRLLSPRWRAASSLTRVAVTAACVGLAVALVGVGLTLENASYAHGGSVPFSFEYRGLYGVAAERGGFVRVQSRWPDGALEYSFAVGPIELPPYSGELTAEMPLFATGFIQALAHRYANFALDAEGKSAISKTLTGYEIAFTATVEGREMLVRDVLLVPPHAGARKGVVVVMLTSPHASSQITHSYEVGTTGVLLRPLKTFAFG
jgi:hypothetical protein